MKNKIKSIESNLELFKKNIQIELEKTFNEKINSHNKKLEVLDKVENLTKIED